MKVTSNLIRESYDKGGPEAVQRTALKMLESDLKAGDTVAVVDDPAWPLQGTKGKVRGESAKGSGYTDVEAPNGIVVPCQTSLLIKVNEDRAEVRRSKERDKAAD